MRVVFGFAKRRREGAQIHFGKESVYEMCVCVCERHCGRYLYYLSIYIYYIQLYIHIVFIENEIIVQIGFGWLVRLDALGQERLATD